jgi:hypothetical protein
MEEEEEIVGAEEHIVRVTKQIASYDTGGSSGTMEEIMQLERVTITVGTMALESVENAPVNDIARSTSSYAVVLDINDRQSQYHHKTKECVIMYLGKIL